MSLIVIQRGHVPRTSGATGAPGEQQFAIETADRCVEHIHGVGHSVRIIDADPPASAYRGDAFFAIHYDSSRDPGVCGASVGYQNAEGGRAARLWKEHYVRNGWTSGFRPDNYTANLGGYYGVRRALEAGNPYAIITEAGFHSNTPDPDPALEDSQLLASPYGPDRVAIAIAATVVDLFGIGGSAPCPPSPGIPAYPGAVKLGNVGRAVEVWQEQFNIHFLGVGTEHSLVVDGDFGLATHHVVVTFQKQRGLVVDGIAGPSTWHELILGG